MKGSHGIKKLYGGVGRGYRGGGRICLNQDKQTGPDKSLTAVASYTFLYQFVV